VTEISREAACDLYQKNFQWRQTGFTITSANGAGQRILWNKMYQHKDPIYYTFGAGQKTTSAMALMDWSVWRH